MRNIKGLSDAGFSLGDVMLCLANARDALASPFPDGVAKARAQLTKADCAVTSALGILPSVVNACAQARFAHRYRPPPAARGGEHMALGLLRVIASALRGNFKGASPAALAGDLDRLIEILRRAG